MVGKINFCKDFVPLTRQQYIESAHLYGAQIDSVKNPSSLFMLHAAKRFYHLNQKIRCINYLIQRIIFIFYTPNWLA